MHIINYYNYGDLASYSVSSSGKVLLMSVNRKDSFGQHDIYVSFLIEDAVWSEPINIGSQINTAASEITPFLGADEKSLYFSSSGHPGYGSHDMFVTKRLDDTWKNWSEPLNLGKRLNTSGWDAYYTIPASGDYAYFVSSENSIGNEDIFRIKLHESVKPESVILVSGKVFNAKTNEPIEAKIIYEDLSTGNEVGIARSDPKNGTYSIVLPAGKKYGFLAEKTGFVARNENIDLVDLSEYKEIKKDLYLVPIEKGQKLTLNNIFFEFGKYELLNESFSELNRIVKILKENENLNIQITGHTDNIGKPQENMELSKQRAKAVANYLKQNGIAPERLIVTGKGALQPIASNNTEEGRQKNRRVDFEIIKD
jgi:outer membrane protein OmpA-like peptidoglycan-associated protein